MINNRIDRTGKKGFLVKGDALQHIVLVAIIVLAVLSRLYNLTFQSLWLDELYTMSIADPGHSIKDIMAYIKTDFHPPLHYIIAHLFFKIVGFNDFSGRLLSALIGILGVIAMYLLGKQIKDKRTGILMALLTSVNYYHIYYSQEIRMYILIFLFSALSGLFLLKALNRNKSIDYVYYTFFTSLLLYTHYFGILVLAAEVLYVLFVFKEKPTFSATRKVAIALVSIMLLYLPWIPHLLMTGSRKHWMGTPDPWYLFVYLYEIVGKDPVTALLFLTGLFLFLKDFFRSGNELPTSKKPKSLLIILMLFSIFILSYFISLVKPILQLRCTIAALPFLIAAVVLELDSFKTRVSHILFSILVISAFINIIFVKKYYSTITKENFRDVSAIVAKTSPNGNFFSHYALYYNYYFKQLNSRITVKYPGTNDPSAILDHSQSFIYLNAHSDKFDAGGAEQLLQGMITGVDVMTPEMYQGWTDYIVTHYTRDTIYQVKESSTENAAVYLLKQP
jgi:uncharacterized membrane protein